jgi:hypothetical protein
MEPGRRRLVFMNLVPPNPTSHTRRNAQQQPPMNWRSPCAERHDERDDQPKQTEGEAQHRSGKKPTLTRSLIVAMTATLLVCSPAFAQVGGSDAAPGLGITSPLGIGPGSPVAPTGMPLGATELASPGVSPSVSSMALSGTTCSGMQSSTSGSSGSTALFDGGGLTGTASGACAGGGSGTLLQPAASASSPAGMGNLSSVRPVGIPLGSTELGAGGLSPPALVFSSPSPTSLPSVTSSASTMSTIVSTTPVVIAPPPTSNASSGSASSSNSAGQESTRQKAKH